MLSLLPLVHNLIDGPHSSPYMLSAALSKEGPKAKADILPQPCLLPVAWANPRGKKQAAVHALANGLGR